MRGYRNGAALIAVAVLAMAWGDSVEGLRLGIAFDDASKLHVVIENNGKVERNIPLGSSSAKGSVYDFEFRITAPNGKEFLLFDMNGPPGVAVSPQPVIAHLAPKQTWETVLSLDKLVFLDGAHSHTLPEMLREHYTVRANLDTTEAARAERTRSEWTGRLRSGELRR